MSDANASAVLHETHAHRDTCGPSSAHARDVERDTDAAPSTIAPATLLVLFDVHGVIATFTRADRMRAHVAGLDPAIRARLHLAHFALASCAPLDVAGDRVEPEPAAHVRTHADALDRDVAGAGTPPGRFPAAFAGEAGRRRTHDPQKPEVPA